MALRSRRAPRSLRGSGRAGPACSRRKAPAQAPLPLPQSLGRRAGPAPLPSERGRGEAVRDGGPRAVPAAGPAAGPGPAGPGGARPRPAECDRSALRARGPRHPGGLRRLQLGQADGPVRAARR